MCAVTGMLTIYEDQLRFDRAVDSCSDSELADSDETDESRSYVRLERHLINSVDISDNSPRPHVTSPFVTNNCHNYPRRLCRSASVGYSSPSVCLSVRIITQKRMMPKCSKLVQGMNFGCLSRDVVWGVKRSKVTVTWSISLVCNFAYYCRTAIHRHSLGGVNSRRRWRLLISLFSGAGLAIITS